MQCWLLAIDPLLIEAMSHHRVWHLLGTEVHSVI